MKLGVELPSIDSVLGRYAKVEVNRLEQLLLPIEQIEDELTPVDWNFKAGQSYLLLSCNEVYIAVAIDLHLVSDLDLF